MVFTLEDLCAKALMKQVLEYRQEFHRDDFPPWYHKIYPCYQELIETQLREKELEDCYILYGWPVFRVMDTWPAT